MPKMNHFMYLSSGKLCGRCGLFFVCFLDISRMLNTAAPYQGYEAVQITESTYMSPSSGQAWTIRWENSRDHYKPTIQYAVSPEGFKVCGASIVRGTFADSIVGVASSMPGCATLWRGCVVGSTFTLYQPFQTTHYIEYKGNRYAHMGTQKIGYTNETGTYATPQMRLNA